MRLYDIVVLVTPDLNDEDATKVAAEYKKILTDGGATVVKEEPWGKRRLAFPILRKREAHYHYWQVQAEPAAVAEAERRMGLSDQVLRHLAVRVDEELKRGAKMAETDPHQGGQAAAAPARRLRRRRAGTASRRPPVERSES